MPVHEKIIEEMDCDYYRQLAPSMLLVNCLSVILSDMQRDGGGRDRLFAACGAIWMISHMRFYAYAPLFPGDAVTCKTFPRVVEGGRYVFYAELYRGAELVVRFDCSFLPVDAVHRRAVRLAAAEPIWNTPAHKAVTKNLRRLRTDCAFTDCGSDTVRFSDTDFNHHLTSSAYLSLACNMLDFWGRETPVYMKMMQVDYASEVLAGTTLRFQRGEKNGTQYIRSLKPDGKLAFTAACIF